MVLRIIKPGEPIPYPSDWPPEKYYVNPGAIPQLQIDGARRLIRRSVSESEIDRYLRARPAVLAACLNFTRFGHHGCWVIPQQAIRLSALPVSPGLKPDYLVGGKNSDGFQWHVVELKSPSDQLFAGRGKGVRLSTQAATGITQLLEYIDYCSAHQAFFRDALRLTGFREPKGILIIGREAEFQRSAVRERLKGAWNRTVTDRLAIRTFDALLRVGKLGL